MKKLIIILLTLFLFSCGSSIEKLTNEDIQKYGNAVDMKEFKGMLGYHTIEYRWVLKERYLKSDDSLYIEYKKSLFGWERQYTSKFAYFYEE